jgi:hypothetical protein
MSPSIAGTLSRMLCHGSSTFPRTHLPGSSVIRGPVGKEKRPALISYRLKVHKPLGPEPLKFAQGLRPLGHYGAGLKFRLRCAEK